MSAQEPRTGHIVQSRLVNRAIAVTVAAVLTRASEPAKVAS
jgi:hypothetical protein